SLSSIRVDQGREYPDRHRQLSYTSPKMLQSGMTRKTSPGAGGKAQQAVPSFKPVRVRARQDGWTPQRQVDFIHALAECGCVRDACGRVGMSAESAYALVRRPDAQSFRIAWELALDNAVRR